MKARNTLPRLGAPLMRENGGLTVPVGTARPAPAPCTVNARAVANARAKAKHRRGGSLGHPEKKP